MKGKKEEKEKEDAGEEMLMPKIHQRVTISSRKHRQQDKKRKGEEKEKKMVS